MKYHSLFTTKKFKVAILSSIMAFSFNSIADEYVEYAKQEVAKASMPKTVWDGPTTGPVLQKNKQIIFIASDMKNGGVQGVHDGLIEAIKATGWKIDILDGAGSVKDQLAALNQAIAKKPDGIVIAGWNPNVAKIPLKKAVQQGIKLVSWQAVPDPGAIPEYNIFYNVSADSKNVARIAALQAVAHSEGTAKVIIFTDSLYQIALDKANVMKDVINQCKQCELLEFIDTPLSDTSNRMPTMTFSLLQKYGDNYQYSLAINDLYFDFMAASLRTANKGGAGAPYNISAGDGSVSAYQRIRTDNSQFATVPGPLKQHGWQLVDELNRAFAGESPSNYVMQVHLVVKDNINADGGKFNIFDPENGYQDHYKAIWGVK